jgi:hypothetical protein
LKISPQRDDDPPSRLGLSRPSVSVAELFLLSPRGAVRI